MAALLFSLWSFTDRHKDRHTEVGTDVRCIWDQARKESVPQLFDEIVTHTNKAKEILKPTKSFYQPISNKIPENLESLWKNAASVGSLAKNYLSSEDSSSDEEEISTFIEICKSHGRNLEDLRAVVTSEMCKKIEEQTRGQNKSPLWMLQRQGRLTASIAHKVVHCKRAQNSLVEKIMNRTTFFGNVHTDYGRNHEDVARALFKQEFFHSHQRPRLWQTGLVVNAVHPHLGASPDCMVSCSCHGKATVEIKCPSTGREKNLLEYVGRRRQQITVDENNKIELRPGEWHSQMQMQMALTETSFGYFVLFLGKHPYIHVCQVPFDSDLWSHNLQVLDKFFLKNVLPQILLEK